MSPLEIAANLLAGASIILAGRNSVHVWWTGIVGCGCSPSCSWVAFSIVAQLLMMRRHVQNWPF